MEFQEKAKIRMEHWLSHSEHHITEYGHFAEEMENAGLKTSAGHLREMIALMVKGNDCLREALSALSAKHE